MDYTIIDEELKKLAQVQATLEFIAKTSLDKFHPDFQREIKRAALDIADLRPRVIKYMSTSFADQEFKRIKAEVEEKLSDKQG